VAAVPWARHDSAFTRAFEDVVVHDAIVGNKQAAADRYGVSWRAVNNMCVRVATEAVGRVDLLGGLAAIAIDEVKYKKGQRYLTVVCDHVTGRVDWAAKGRSKDTVGLFFDQLGDRAPQIAFVTADGARWITDVVAVRAPDAIVCLDTFHVISWATGALDEWLAYASRSKLPPFVKLARTIRRYRPSIEATIEWRLTNGIAESNNASIGRIRANARGFHDPEAFITMIMLDRAGIAPDLPWTTAS
jgi:transposase